MGIFPDAQVQLKLQSTVRSGQISNSSKTLWLSSLPAKNNPIKNRGARVFTTLYINFSDVQGPNFELVRDVIDVLVTCQYEEDQIKNEGARVLTTLYINFSDAQGQITLKLVVVSGRNLNSSKLSYMSSLPARMRMIDSKMKELECSQDFSK